MEFHLSFSSFNGNHSAFSSVSFLLGIMVALLLGCLSAFQPAVILLVYSAFWAVILALPVYSAFWAVILPIYFTFWAVIPVYFTFWAVILPVYFTFWAVILLVYSGSVLV